MSGLRGSFMLFCSAMVLGSVSSSEAASVLAIDLNPMTQVEEQLSVPVPSGIFYGFYEYMPTNGMFGWSFSVLRPMIVTGLAWFDEGMDGLSYAHQVGIWQTGKYPDTNVQLLASAVVSAGTNAALVGEVWRSVALASPLTLQAGNYLIGGTWFSQTPDLVKYVQSSPIPIPADARIVIGSPALSDPTMRGVPPDPLFQPPLTFILVWGVELGPNLLVVPEIPALRIDPFGDQTVLSWPSWATNYVSEATSDIGLPASWTPLTNATVVSEGRILQTNAVGSAVEFYRLRKL